MLEYRRHFNKLIKAKEVAEPTTSPERIRAQKEHWEKQKQRKDSDYNWQDKVKHVRPWMRGFDDAGLIGNTVIDVGGGRRPTSFFLRKPGRQIFSVDFVKPIIGGGDIHHIKGDVRAVNHNSITKKRALLEIAEQLGIDPHTASPKQVDTLIFSDILNYVPYEQTIRSFAEYLKPDGTMIIYNQPGRTFEGKEELLLDPQGVKSTSEMVKRVEKLGFRRLVFVPVGKKMPELDNDQYMSFSLFQKMNWLKKTYQDLRYGHIGIDPNDREAENER